ncbi:MULTISPECIES: methylated-DNA--[protein]-cysteine S-methyltransferase [Bacillaceae]|uniref:methylated-DNA--[protein]-cysteine S-methyltransferase n=1 Tax=Bacillaceae TaxID=186817 RepID=UPI000BECA6EB|nr:MULTISPECIES: methylated-DNA--[protein]-cysteine S-methyltransferase [unclassified Bacillus (in: firmicutes)]PEC48201.1 cysteine methyltransferase [Bacillus sp. AFS096315]PFM83454.1 cysteine methyltransferase [Bacillus sp. AFS077874]
MNQLDTAYIDTPLGTLRIVGNEKGVAFIDFVKEENDEIQKIVPPSLKNAGNELIEYFSGFRKEFSIQSIAKGTPFQESVWRELVKIKYGETASYADIANRIGNPKAVRAVANANARNPLSIIVPCHRIIGSNGKLTGYAGGLWRKEWLLNREQGRETFKL